MLTPLSARRRAGFTLIELLVVIAIIAILTAIIFPVFATVRENARQQSSIASLHQIQTGIAQFKLDQGVYPPVLFGYALPGARMDNALQMAEAESQYAAAQYFPGVYPEYVNNPLTFTDGNNPTNDLSKTTGALAVNALTPVAPATSPETFTLSSQTTYPYTNPVSAGAVPTNFYVADAFDSSPQITGTNQLSNTQYVVRYQPNWTDVSNNDSGNFDGTAPTGNKPFLNYNRQLRWSNPPSDTYVTSTTYHVPYDNRVLVLWQTGDAKSIDASRFLAGASGACTGSDAPSANSAYFWQVSPTDQTNPGFGGSAACP